MKKEKIQGSSQMIKKSQQKKSLDEDSASKIKNNVT